VSHEPFFSFFVRGLSVIVAILDAIAVNYEAERGVWECSLMLFRGVVVKVGVISSIVRESRGVLYV
jgi:hypothetical protein